MNNAERGDNNIQQRRESWCHESNERIEQEKGIYIKPYEDEPTS